MCACCNVWCLHLMQCMEGNGSGACKGAACGRPECLPHLNHMDLHHTSLIVTRPQIPSKTQLRTQSCYSICSQLCRCTTIAVATKCEGFGHRPGCKLHRAMHHSPLSKDLQLQKNSMLWFSPLLLQQLSERCHALEGEAQDTSVTNLNALGVTDS